MKNIYKIVNVFAVSVLLFYSCETKRSDDNTDHRGSTTFSDVDKMDLCDPRNESYRIKVLKLPSPENIPGSSDSAKLVPFLQQGVDKLSWIIFIALNWPANDNGSPDSTLCFGQKDGITVWEHWMPGSQLFPKEDDTVLTTWQYGLTKQGHPKNSDAAPSFSFMKLSDFDEFNPDRQRVPNVHGDNTLYEIFYNKKVYDYVRKGGLATVKGQKEFIKKWPRQSDGVFLIDSLSGDTVSFEARDERVYLPIGVSNDSVFSYQYIDRNSQSLQLRNGFLHYKANIGAMAVKSAWTVLTSKEKVEKYHTRKVILDGKQVTLGLVALHFAHKIAEAPRWVWSTFEHIDNAPLLGKNGLAELEPGKDYLYFNRQFNDSATYNKPPKEGSNSGKVQIVRLQERTKELDDLNAQYHKIIQRANNNSVWLNYRLVGTQWPFNNPDPLTIVGGPGDTRPAIMANALMETYHQSTSSCMGCHQKARFLKTNEHQNGFFADFMWGIANVGQPK